MLLLVLLAAITQLDEPFRVHVGDDPSFASPRFDDSAWQLAYMPDVKETGVMWLRKKIELRAADRASGRPLAIFYAGLGSHELWWDGQKIGGSGVVGVTPAAEVPGRTDQHYLIPDRLSSPGTHTLALRVSAWHRGFVPKSGYWSIYIDDYDVVVDLRTRSSHYAMAAVTGIIVTGVFAFAMYWVARRDRTFLLLGTLCLTATALLFAESWRQLFGYTYDWHIVRLRLIVALSWLVGIQIVALVVTRFPHRNGRTVLALTALAAAVAPLVPQAWDPKSLFIFAICCSVSVFWTIFAVARRMHGSVLALIGVSMATIAFFYDFALWLDQNIFFALDFLFICLLCSHALEVRRDRNARARLELEMLRRQLQPHFLMNTLTALSEWIEQEPKTAVRMIEALSEELRILASMSRQRLVTAGDEIQLCQTHVENMSLRKDVSYRLQVEGVDLNRLVPPAIFHSLVENAITHGPSEDRVTLRLSARTEKGRTHYVFESPAGEQEPFTPGGGTRYIEARLREVWGDAWTFRQGRAGDIWRAEIEVPA